MAYTRRAGVSVYRAGAYRHGCPGPRDWLGTSRRVDITAGIPIPAVNLANEPSTAGACIHARMTLP